MNKTILIIIAVVAVIGVGLLAYQGTWEWPLNPENPSDISGVWSAELIVVDTNGNEHTVNTNIDTETIKWQGYNVDKFFLNLGINPTNLDGQSYSTITLNMPEENYDCEYSISGIVDHATSTFKDPSGSEVDGEYSFVVDGGTQLVATSTISTGSIEALMTYLGASYGSYTLTYYLSGNFTYYVDSTEDWKDVPLGQIEVDISFDWSQTTLNIVNIEWDHTTGGQ